MDAKNTLIQHTIVGVFSLAIAAVFYFLFDIRWSTSFARVSFILLFLALIIGPVMKLKKPAEVSSPLAIPWSWRGELGIWFTLTALVHFIFVLLNRSFFKLIYVGGGGGALSNFIGLIALLLAIVLTFTSINKVIIFLGVESWKWLHGLTYVIFYLIAAHFIYYQFFSTYGEIGPDWFGYLASAMTIIILILQAIAFVMVIKKRKASSLENN